MKYLTALVVFLALLVLDVVLMAFFVGTLMIGALIYFDDKRPFPLSYEFAKKIWD